ncbi:GNAT family N-acetyltransferase [Peteryoungia ipomoeae]|uniref:GNAT family N-acetyltransferase n=1 Tax=Peteryoungia ipomoeae TaxID=1210932 RepID=A0A4V4HMP1_9HYPH|nr:GNAT family N-acetyltransferase [Peteryoungia ipomoeae]THV23016.1 GNAT family N-acetyltransferase [Peteryoungia ipomoeae]
MDASTRGLERRPGETAPRFSVARIRFEGRQFDLECRDSLADLAALEETWKALEERCPEPFTYFQSADWCLNWARIFLADAAGSDASAKVYILWEGADCRMIWPLMMRRASPAITVLEPLTAPMNQYTTLLYDPQGFGPDLGRQVCDEIARHCGGDAICLDHVPQSSLLAQMLDGKGYTPDRQQHSSILDLAGLADWERHHRALPKKQRLQRNSRRNRLEKLGVLDYQVWPADSAGYAAHIDRCIAMKQDWLKETGRLGRDLFDPRFAAFLRTLGAVKGEDHGRVYLHALTLDGTPIAMELGMRFHQDYYCFLGAIDLAYQKYSPGKVQMESAQRWAIETGISRFDFLSDPSAYKSSWTNTCVPLTASYMPFTSLGQLYCQHWMAGLRPRLRAFYHGFGPAWKARVRTLFDSVNRFMGRNGSTMGFVLCCVP